MNLGEEQKELEIEPVEWPQAVPTPLPQPGIPEPVPVERES